MSADLVKASGVVGRLCDRLEQLELELISERIKFTTAEAVWSSFTEKILTQLAAEKALADDYKVFVEKCGTTWDEALMKAAGLAMKGPEEGGVAKSLAFFAKEEDHWVYRQACLDYARAILELKRS